LSAAEISPRPSCQQTVNRPVSGTIFSGGEPFSVPATGCGLSVGNFDGVHLGHREIIRQLRELASSHGLPAVAVTFDPHPATLLRPDRVPPPLTTVMRRAELLLSLGLDAVLVLETTPDLLRLSPEEFYERVLRGCLRGAAFVEGKDFRFGSERQGDTEQLRAWAGRDGLAFAAVSPVVAADAAVSSSRVRQLLLSGESVAAAELLGAAYAISGTVEHGQHRGAAIGFPTANLAGIPTLLPAEGVYAGLATTAAGSRHAAAIHVGKNLTFAAARPTVEVHLIDFSGDLYGQPLRVAFGRRLRDTCRFAGVEELIGQLGRDVADAAAAAVADAAWPPPRVTTTSLRG
jgi:riboflavin kinase/FMN adenylyltransferase